MDRMWRGQMRKLLLHADRNGIFYVLDRTNGKLLSGTPFVHVNWMTGFDANGRPISGARIEFEPRAAASSCIPRSAAPRISRRRRTAR